MPAVTGLGAICALGNNIEETFQGLLDGRRPARMASHLSSAVDATTVPLVAEVALSDSELRALVDAPAAALKRVSRSGLFSLIVAQQALRDAGLTGDSASEKRIGIFAGSTLSGTNDLEAMYREFVKTRKTKRPSLALSGRYTVLNDLIASLHGIKGQRMVVSTACSSSTVIFKFAQMLLANNELDAALLYGVDTITELSLAGFISLGAPSKAMSSPFSDGDPGLTLGEGAAALVLERDPGLKKVYAHVVGTAISSDAYHATAPDPQGRGARQAMSEALRVSGLAPSAVQVIYAHGSGTELNDAAESKAIQGAFGAAAANLAVLSTKGATGHTLGAAGILNTVLAAKSIETGLIPPSPGFISPRKGCTLNYPAKVLKVDVRAAVANSFGFGGTNSSVVLSRHEAVATLAPPSGRLLISGIGAVTPWGVDLETLQTNILNGVEFNTPHEETVAFTGRRRADHAGVVALDDPKIAAVLRRSRNSRRMDRLSSLTFVANSLALSHSGIKLSAANREKVAVLLGTDSGPGGAIHKFFHGVTQDGIRRGNPSVFPNTVLNAGLGYLAIDHMIHGPTVIFPQGEVASGLALEMGDRMLRLDPSVEAVLCGGVDEYSVSREQGLLSLGQIPAKLAQVRPLDRSSQGYSLGEAAITFVIEREAALAARGGRAVAELVGSLSSGADLPGPHSFSKAGASVTDVLNRGAQQFGRPELVIVNGTGYRPLDRVLVAGYRESAIRGVPLYSPLGLFGNVFGTSSALGVLAAITALQRQAIPAVARCEEPLDENVSTSLAINRRVDLVFVVSTAVGGHTTLQAIRKLVTS